MFSYFRPRHRAVASRLRRAGPIAAAVTVALIMVPSASSGSYTDKTGDNASAGDIAGIQVATDKASGQLVFQLTGSNLSPSPSIPTLLLIDSDSNPLTGNIESVGADYLFAVDDTSYFFGHWNGTDWVDTANLSVRVTGGTSALTISVNRNELNNTVDLNFWARSLDVATGKTDDAPDDGVFNYSIEANGPDIQSIDVKTAPSGGPRVGKKFGITPVGLKLPPDGALSLARTADSYSCKAKLGTRSLRGTGTGGCTFAIPKRKSKGKQLRVTVTVNYQGASKAFNYAFKVR